MCVSYNSRIATSLQKNLTRIGGSPSSSQKLGFEKLRAMSAEDVLIEELLQGRRRQRERPRNQRSHPSLHRDGLLRQIYLVMQPHAGELDPLSPYATHFSRCESVEPLLPEREHEPDPPASEMTNDILSKWRQNLARQHSMSPHNPMGTDTGTEYTPSHANVRSGGMLVFFQSHWRRICLVGLGLACLLFVEERARVVPSDPTVDRFTQFLDCAEELSPGVDLSQYRSPEYKAVDWLRAQSELVFAPAECSTWDSPFGMAYAMFLVRHHLGFDVAFRVYAAGGREFIAIRRSTLPSWYLTMQILLDRSLLS